MKFILFFIISLFLITSVLAETTFFDNENEVFIIGTIPTAEKHNVILKEKIYWGCPHNYTFREGKCINDTNMSKIELNSEDITNLQLNVSNKTVYEEVIFFKTDETKIIKIKTDKNKTEGKTILFIIIIGLLFLIKIVKKRFNY